MNPRDLLRLIDSFHICEADWDLYQQLFMNGPARANTLNSLSGPLFAAIHLCLIEITFVRISKLTDGRKTGKNLNLTLDALREENKRGFGMEEKYKEIIESAAVEKIRSYRNKIIAHSDLATAQAPDPSTELGSVIHNNVTMALDYIRAFLYEYCNEVGQSIPPPRPVPNIDEFLAKFNCA
jgi:HEPN superfamily AbiU2-like protein